MSRLSRAINSISTNEICEENRGKYPTRKTDVADIEFLKSFISTFPAYESHYSAANSSKKYLSPNLNIIKMYREYELVTKFHKLKTLREWQFRHIFNTEFNLSFHALQTDTCKNCDQLKHALKAETCLVKQNELLEKKTYHLACDSFIRTNFKRLVEVQSDNKTVVLTFDLQRVLELPSIKTNQAYYKRQLWFYNLCVYNEAQKKATMYVWYESIGSKGSQEIASCLYRYFIDYVPQDTQNIILYSDSCGGQNRNIKMTLMLKKFLDDKILPNLEKNNASF